MKGFEGRVKVSGRFGRIVKLSLIIIIVGLLAGSCSKKSVSRAEKNEAEHERSESLSDATEEGEDEEAPEAEDIEVDCVAFLRATTAAPAKDGSANGNCPTCPTGEQAPEVLKFDQVKIDRISSSQTTCEVAVRIFGTFNPSRSGAIVGGLTRWISSEQKEQYARGETPSGQQIYPVKVTYRKTAHGWKPVEFN